MAFHHLAAPLHFDGFTGKAKARGGSAKLSVSNAADKAEDARISLSQELSSGLT